MHLRKSKKSIFYFFLLIMFGSINNINLRNIEINKIKSINVDGFENEDTIIITEKISDLKLDNIFFLDSKKLKKYWIVILWLTNMMFLKIIHHL